MNWKVIGYAEVYSFEETKGIGWWKICIWRLNGLRGNIGQGICPVCRKEEGLESHTEM
jgi:hypothetical protein